MAKGAKDMLEKQWERQLNIQTGADWSFFPFLYYYPYEPTPYHVLEILAEQFKICSHDHVVDFGSGKGRLCFYLNAVFNASTRGIEINEELVSAAKKNLNRYIKKFPNGKDRIFFDHIRAEHYEIRPGDNKFYFFNPFSVQIFIKVINNILLSVERFPRDVDVILYYPSIEYIPFLENRTSFTLTKEIFISGDYERDQNERILIYSLKTGGKNNIND